jgi:hypothetical protein
MVGGDVEKVNVHLIVSTGPEAGLTTWNVDYYFPIIQVGTLIHQSLQNLNTVENQPISLAPSIEVLLPGLFPGAPSIAALSTTLNADSISQYRIFDGGGGNGQLIVDNAVQPDGQWINLTTGDTVKFIPGSSGETIYVQAFDPATSSWTDFGALTINPVAPLTAQEIQNDYLGIVRGTLSTDQATTEANAINAGTTTEVDYINGLLSQVADTTIPAVAVEASMYNAVGTSAEITMLVTQYLPTQIAFAIQNGFSPIVFATEALGLAFAFSNENGATTFAANFGPGNAAMPNSAAGDAAFAAAASTAIFGAQSTPTLVNFISSHLNYWVNLYTASGLPGNPNPTADQIDLAARGAAWGDGVGIALVYNVGPLPAQATNFLQDAAQGNAVYSSSLSSQQPSLPFEGASAVTTTTISPTGSVGMTGVAAHTDHVLM